MNPIQISNQSDDLDDLRLMALGRIQRCAECDLYRALLAIQDGDSRPASALPQAPDSCKHKVCSPLAVRLARAEEHPVRILKAVYGF